MDTHNGQAAAFNSKATFCFDLQPGRLTILAADEDYHTNGSVKQNQFDQNGTWVYRRIRVPR